VVGTLGILFGVADATENNPTLAVSIAGMFTAASAFAFVAFNMICAPCFAAIGAIRREMGSWKWTFITLGFQTFTAYLLALIINQVGNFLLGSGSLIGAIISVIIVVAVISIVTLPGISSKEKINGEFSYTK
jgi:ferrous iron transport protein B